MWWRRPTTHTDLGDAIRLEQQRKYHRELKQKNDAQQRADERDWQRKSSFTRPTAPKQEQVWPRHKDDGLLIRGAKRFVNNQWYDHQISWRRWQYEREEKRQEKQAEQARPHPRPGSGAGTAESPFIMGDQSRQWRPFGQGAPAPEPTQAHARGPRR
jgi:hypothetical protein